MSEILRKIRAGELPEHANEALVKGILPLEPEELIVALFLICTSHPDLLGQAKQTFGGLPDGGKTSFFEKRELDPDINHFYLSQFQLPLETKSVMLLNATTRGQTLAEIAPHLEAQLIDLVVNNQVKILETPEIIEALRQNQGLSINQKQKLDEYERLLLNKGVDDAKILETKTIKEVEEEAIRDAQDFVQAFGKEKGAPLRTSPSKPTSKVAETKPTSKAAQTQVSVGDDQAKKSDDRKSKPSFLEQLANMSVPQKIQAAIKGDREVRSTLIRDSNKLVCCSVIKSPRITDSEVEFYANLRNVQTDVLRLIAQNREWTKSYKVIHSLIKNPRTPIAFTTRLLPRLNKTDLKNLERDRGVPEALRIQSRRLSRGN